MLKSELELAIKELFSDDFYEQWKRDDEFFYYYKGGDLRIRYNVPGDVSFHYVGEKIDLFIRFSDVDELRFIKHGLCYMLKVLNNTKEE